MFSEQIGERDRIYEWYLKHFYYIMSLLSYLLSQLFMITIYLAACVATVLYRTIRDT